MQQVYKGILRGDRVEWLGAAPETNGGVPVQVTVLSQQQVGESDLEARRRRVRDALNALASGGAFAAIQDPVEWQREIRKDRPLPGRDE
jgi:hypothetical protein